MTGWVTYQNDPQTPQVAGLVVAVVLEDLGSGVLQREAGRLQQLLVWWFETSKAKVYDFYPRVLTLICEEQVLRGNLRHGQQSCFLLFTTITAPQSQL